MRRPASWRAFSVVVLALAGGDAGARDVLSAEGSSSPVFSNPEETMREFQEYCEAFRQSSNEYYGRVQIESLERQIGDPGASLEHQIGARGLLAHHLLRVGQPARAVELLQEALEVTNEKQMGYELSLQLTRDLGLAFLRLGEVSNCVAMHGPAMCVLPIGPDGQHRDPAGSRGALKAYAAYLTEKPQDATVTWLFNIAAMTLGLFPDDIPESHRADPERMTSSQDIDRFPDVASQVGLRITDSSGGGILDDFDGDGDLDVLTSSADPCSPLRYFLNDGAGRFEDRTKAAQLHGQLGGLNLLQADYDNDGNLDIFVLRGGWFDADGRIRNSLLRGNGDGTFLDVTQAAGLAYPAYPTQAGAFADFDLDGDLDLYVANESPVNGPENYPSQLFRNNGDGTFTDIAAAADVRNDRFGKAAAWGDYDNDGDPDLYVSNIGPNRLYRNDGNGQFTDVATELEVTGPETRSFATWFFDYDNDGWLDLFVADYSATTEQVAAHFLGQEIGQGHPRVYRNEAGRFVDRSRVLGLTAPALPMGANYGDLDNDGFLDFYLGTGLPDFEALMPNLMYRNDGGERFVDITYSGGFGHLQKGHGVAFGDVDHDGDQDVFEQMGGVYPGDTYPSVLYLNPGHGNAWIALELLGVRSNRNGMGARLELQVQTPDGVRSVHAHAGAGGSFGGSSLRQEIGLGQAKIVRLLTIRWPIDGSVQSFEEVEPNRFYRVVEGQPKLELLSRPQIELPPRP